MRGTLVGLGEALDQIGQRLATLRSSGQERLREALRLSQAVLEAMPDPVVVFDGDACLHSFNSAARALFGAGLKPGSPAADLGDAVLQLAAEEASLGFPMASNQVPHVNLVQGGLKRRFRLRALPLQSARGAVVVLQDVTDTDAEVDLFRQAAQSALFELRPLADALGVALQAAQAPGLPGAAGLEEWQALDSVLRDVEGATTDTAPERTDLMALVESALDAVALEAQRAHVKVQREFDRPTPSVFTSATATRRLLLRLLRGSLRTCAEGDTLRVEVRGVPRPSVWISPGVLPDTPLDAVLLDRSQIVARTDSNPSGVGRSTVLQFAQHGD